MSSTTDFTQIHKEDLEVLSGRRGDARLRAVRLNELDGLIGGGNSVVSRLNQTTALIGNATTPGTVLGTLATVTTHAEQAAQDANQARQDAEQVSQDLANTTLQLTNAIAQVETKIGGDFSHVNGFVPGYAVIFDDKGKLYRNPTGSALTGQPELGFDDTITVTDQGLSRVFSGETNGALRLEIPVTTTGALEGVQAKISILVKATTTNPATHLVFAYSTDGFGGSGLLNAPVPSEWAWVDFLYTVPLGSGIRDHYIGLWPDLADGAGTSFKAAAISVQIASQALDLPAVEDLRATVRQISALDGTADSAFATMLNELSVTADGKVAGIDNFGTAMADIHGKTQAAYLLRAKAGGEAAEFEMVAWDDVEGGGSAIKMSADLIVAEGTLSTDKLVTGATANLLNDPAFAQGFRGWELSPTESSGGVYTETTLSLRPAGDSYAGATFPTFMMWQDGVDTVGEAVLYINSPTGTPLNISCKPGDWLDFSAYFFSLRCEFKVEIVFLDGFETVTGTAEIMARGTATDGGTGNPDIWKRIWGKAQAPASTDFATIRITKYGTASGADSYLFINKPMVSQSHADANEPAVWTPGGATVINGGNIVADSIGREQLRVGSIFAEHLNSKEVKADFIEVDDYLDIDAQDAGLRMDKQSVGDFVNDGVYMGRHDDGQGGAPAFGFFIGRTNNGSEEYIRLTKEDGLVIKNANYLIGSGAHTENTYTSSQTVSLLGKDRFSAFLQAGGGGGRGGTDYDDNGGSSGSKGGNTIVRLYDGDTLIQTWTATGGNGGSSKKSSSQPGQSTSLSPRGDSGSGGTPGRYEYATRHPSTNELRHYEIEGLYGDNGSKGGTKSISSVDISGLTDPKLVITIGAGGTGGPGGGSNSSGTNSQNNTPWEYFKGGTGGSGKSGAVQVQTSSDIFVDAAPVSVNPTARGSFYVGSSSGNFPDIAPGRGLWSVWSAPSTFRVEFDSTTTIVTNYSMSFVASKRPRWTERSSNTTVYYAFWAM